MRGEQEMMDLILGFARNHDDIRAVVMTGSRTNPTVARDRFQDFDITYLVEDVTPYRRNEEIPRYFGDIMILQLPDDMGECPGPLPTYAYLMQFTDGNRIDLTFRPVHDVNEILEDSLSLVLLDKDGRFSLPPPTVESYLPQKPVAKQFGDCCNEFWWLNPYVAKGLYRSQVTYARSILDGPMREQLMKMLTWHFGLATDFRIDPGLFGKNLKPHIAADLWELLEGTYSDARPDHIWNALFAMDELFRRTARGVAAAFGFAYAQREDDAVSSFVLQIREWTAPVV